MRTELAFLCDSALDDRGKLHALGIGIDRVDGAALPMTHPRFVLVCVVRYSAVETGSKRMAIRLLDPDAADTIPPIEQAIAFPVRPGVVESDVRIIAEVNGVAFQQAGPHAFHLTIDGSEMARLPISVNVNVNVGGRS